MMHSFVKSLPDRTALAITAALSAAWLLAAIPFLQADPVLRGTSVQEHEIATAPEAVPANAAGEIYGDWSRRRLEAEKANAVVQHPLANAHPEHFVVVCEAGCSAGYSDVVDMTLRDPQVPASRRRANNPDPISPELIKNGAVCVGGCYNDAGPEATAAAAHSDPAITDWMARPAPGTNPPATQTYRRWHDRIGNPDAR